MTDKEMSDALGDEASALQRKAAGLRILAKRFCGSDRRRSGADLDLAAATLETVVRLLDRIENEIDRDMRREASKSL